MLKMEGRLGTISPGAIADILILDRNPLDDITVLDRPEIYLRAVYKEGRKYKG
jgi:imidazolonepropionase-like amidohydrolase